MQIKDNSTLDWVEKLKGDPNKRSKEKYCHFHYDNGHNTSECYELKSQIEALIGKGKLQQFVKVDLGYNLTRIRATQQSGRAGQSTLWRDKNDHKRHYKIDGSET